MRIGLAGISGGNAIWTRKPAGVWLEHISNDDLTADGDFRLPN
ncbi:MAG TPA: hypothetical protein VLE70_10160 [Anaerolineae bacterium]|nr:hypothetical protein [Anaerolineae bacterium]